MKPTLVALNIYNIIATLEPTSQPHRNNIIVYIVVSLQPNCSLLCNRIAEPSPPHRSINTAMVSATLKQKRLDC